MKGEKRNIFVTGHRNPDTDSICSAIAYANFKNTVDDKHNYIAKRIGDINEESQFVLDYFSVEGPEFLGDVSTQVKDIDFRKIEGLTKDYTLKSSWTYMQERNIVTLPIIEGDRLVGIINLNDIVRFYLDRNDAVTISEAKTTYGNICAAIGGELLVGNPEEAMLEGKVLVAAAEVDILKKYLRRGDLIITANRVDAQRSIIELGAACMVVTAGAEIGDELLDLAKKKSCTVIVTDCDTYTAARLITQSVPIEYIMKEEDIVTFSADDYIRDVKRIIAQQKYRDFPVLDDEGRYLGMLSRRFLVDTKKKEIILVDHNEKGQSVNGVEEAEILEIIDHHRIGTVETMAPVFFRNQPVGSTATIVSLIYGENRVEIPREIAGILCAAIISDTLIFRSPTSTETDLNQAHKLADIAGIDIDEFAYKMFSLGNDLEGKKAKDFFYKDYKTFSKKNVDFGIGQISSVDKKELKDIKELVIPYMEDLYNNSRIDMIVFMLTDIMDKSSEIVYVGASAPEILSKAFKLKVDGPFILEDTVSRKKQIVPPLLEAIEGME